MHDVTTAMGYDKDIKFAGNCKLLELPTPAEDLSIFDEHSAFAGAGDLWNTFIKGSSSATDGGVWLVNATAGNIRRLATGLKRKLVLHGIYYSKISQKLYAVNHDEAHGESVEVFDVTGAGRDVRVKHAAS